jgi:hypothetical protein
MSNPAGTLIDLGSGMGEGETLPAYMLLNFLNQLVIPWLPLSSQYARYFWGVVPYSSFILDIHISIIDKNVCVLLPRGVSNLISTFLYLATYIRIDKVFKAL